MVKKKEEHTTFEVGPISEPRMRDIMEGLWQEGGYGREALRKELREHPGDLDADAVDYINNPILTNGLPGEFDDFGLHIPSAAYDEVADKVYIAYTGHKTSFFNAVGIGIAESVDGFVFTKLAENPVVTPPAGFDMVGTGGGSLMYDYLAKRWRMYLHLRNAATSIWDTIGVAEAASIHGPWTWISTSAVNIPGVRLTDASIIYLGATGLGVGLNNYVLSFLRPATWQLNIYGSANGLTFAAIAGGIGFAHYPDLTLARTLGKTAFEANTLRFFNDWFFLFYESANQSSTSYEFHVALGKSPLNLAHSSLNSLLISVSYGIARGVLIHPCPLITPSNFYLYYLIHNWETNRTQYMNVAVLNRSLLDKLLKDVPIYGYLREPTVTRLHLPWKNRTIAVNEVANFPLNLLRYHRKTLYFRSDTAGTLTIEADPLGDGEWDTYDTMVLGAGDLNVWKPYIITGKMPYLRVSFNQIASVSCVLVVGE